jgi:CdiI immunity protein
MSEPTRPRNTVPPTPPNIDVREFAALREFLRGYLHEDFMQEYGSVGNAVRQFAQDTDHEQRAEVVRQWEKFLELTRPQPLPVVAGLLITRLGSAWSPRHPTELEDLTNYMRALLPESGAT